MLQSFDVKWAHNFLMQLVMRNQAYLVLMLLVPDKPNEATNDTKEPRYNPVNLKASFNYHGT